MKHSTTDFKKPLSAPKQRGFTLVELLIVIIVIGILAAITIIAYTGVTQRAASVSMKSDLQTAAVTLETYYQTNHSYPIDTASANLKVSSTNQLTYMAKPYGYCMTITNTRVTGSLQIKSTDQKIVDGDCSVQVTTLAGDGAAAYLDGTGTAAEFSYPQGVAVAASGTVYVADTGNNRIRSITPDGVVTTIANSTSFVGPMDLVVDGSGNVYEVEQSGHRVRVITPAGVVTTLAGNGSRGYVDATGTAARFNYPTGIAVDSSGNVYVSDTGNQRIRKITPAGVVTTLAGNGTAGYLDATGTAAQFNNPRGLAVDNFGNVYVADSSNQRIRKITPAGVVTTFAGSGTAGYLDATGTAAQLNGPTGIAVDSSGNVYVADYNSPHIRVITPAGVVTTLAGNGINGHVDGAATSAEFHSPTGLSVDASGTVYVADYKGNVIREITQ